MEKVLHGRESKWKAGNRPLKYVTTGTPLSPTKTKKALETKHRTNLAGCENDKSSWGLMNPNKSL